MCIIVVKPAKSKLPVESVLRQCWKYNDDGAGFAYRQDGVVKLRKGFMTFEALMRALGEVPQNLPMIIHFRYATHGLKDFSATHPFPISDSQKMLKEPWVDGNDVIAHNGIIRVPLVGDLSDTQSFIATHTDLVNSLKSGRILPEHDAVYKEAVGSCRLAILTKESDTIIRYGDWVKEKYDTGKIYFSNSGYKVYEYRQYKYSDSRVGGFEKCWCGGWEHKHTNDFGPLCYKHYTKYTELVDKASAKENTEVIKEPTCEFCGAPGVFRLEGVACCYSCLDLMRFNNFQGA